MLRYELLRVWEYLEHELILIDKGKKKKELDKEGPKEWEKHVDAYLDKYMAFEIDGPNGKQITKMLQLAVGQGFREDERKKGHPHPNFTTLFQLVKDKE